MKNGINTTISDSFVYGIVMIIANIAGTVGLIASLILIRTLRGELGPFSIKGSGWLWFIPLVLLISSVAIAVTALVTRFYFSYKIPDILPRKNDDVMDWKIIWRHFAFMVLPAEIFRFITAVLWVIPGPVYGYRLLDGFLAIAPNFIFDQFYITPAGRLEGIRNAGYAMGENFLFAAIYLVYFAITICVLYFIFFRLWEKCVNAQNSEVKLRMDPEQMK